MNITLPEEERGEATSVSTPENASSPCDSLSEREIALYMTISWWFEGLMQVSLKRYLSKKGVQAIFINSVPYF